MAVSIDKERLRELCEAVEKEQDSERVLELCLEINDLLEQKHPRDQKPLPAA